MSRFHDNRVVPGVSDCAWTPANPDSGELILGARILTLLALSINVKWIMAAFGLAPSVDTERLIMGMRAVAALRPGSVPVHYAVLKRLLAIV